MSRVARFLKDIIKNKTLKQRLLDNDAIFKTIETKVPVTSSNILKSNDGQKEVKDNFVNTESKLNVDHNDKKKVNNVFVNTETSLNTNIDTSLNASDNENSKVWDDVYVNTKSKLNDNHSENNTDRFVNNVCVNTKSKQNGSHERSHFDTNKNNCRKFQNLSHQRSKISRKAGGLEYFQKLVETSRYDDNLESVVGNLEDKKETLNLDPLTSARNGSVSERWDQSMSVEVKKNDSSKSIIDKSFNEDVTVTSTTENGNNFQTNLNCSSEINENLAIVNKNKTNSKEEMKSQPLSKESNSSVECVDMEQLSQVSSEEMRSMSFIEELGSELSVEERSSESLMSRSYDEDLKLETSSKISDEELKVMSFIEDFASVSSVGDADSDSQGSRSFGDLELKPFSSNPDENNVSVPAIDELESLSSVDDVKPECVNDNQIKEKEDEESIYMYAGENVMSRMRDKEKSTNLGDSMIKLRNDEEILSEILEVDQELSPLDGIEYSLQKKTKGGPLPKSYSLATYVDKSELLTNLVKLGADLSLMERDSDIANFLIRLNYKRDVEPRLFFLRDIGITDDHFGKVITKNPFILKESIENLQARVNYFASKKFLADEIASIVTRTPNILTMKVKIIDAKLGYYQKQFKLTGTEVRLVVNTFPKVVMLNVERVKDTYSYFIEFLEFTDVEMKKMFLGYPRLFMRSKPAVVKKFNYMYDVMGLSYKTMTDFPKVFGTRLFIMQQRHKYLVSLGRAQYDPTVENYISPLRLVKGCDEEFCEKVAKTTHEDFIQFLKTL